MNEITKRILHQLNNEFVNLGVQEGELVCQLDKINKNMSDIQETVKLLKTEE